MGFARSRFSLKFSIVLKTPYKTLSLTVKCDAGDAIDAGNAVDAYVVADFVVKCTHINGDDDEVAKVEER
jgi:hypothetical protein